MIQGTHVINIKENNMPEVPFADFLDDEKVHNPYLDQYFKRIECPACSMIIYEEFDYAGKQMTYFYQEHYKEEHIECKKDLDNCDCDKNSCSKKCGCS